MQDIPETNNYSRSLAFFSERREAPYVQFFFVSLCFGQIKKMISNHVPLKRMLNWSVAHKPLGNLIIPEP
jgi:hypothetical protein